MAKVSKQLQLLQAALTELFTGLLAREPFRLVDFTKSGGDPVSINPAEVVLIEVRKGKVSILFSSGDRVALDGTLSDAIDKLEE